MRSAILVRKKKTDCKARRAEAQRLHTTRRGEHLRDVALDFYTVPDLFQIAVYADQEGAADDALEGAAHEFLHAPDTVDLQHLVRRIAEQREV